MLNRRYCISGITSRTVTKSIEEIREHKVLKEGKKTVSQQSNNEKPKDKNKEKPTMNNQEPQYTRRGRSCSRSRND